MEVANKPIIISIVSGKGGCGKTRIATALARFLSETSNVLLVDMDLHNQGLTTLLNPEITANNHTVYEILNSKNYDYDKKPIKINNKLFFIPSINQQFEFQNDIRKIGRDTEKIYEKMNELINNLINSNTFEINCVIFDNTGLPDEFSIGSSLCSNKILIITQPDEVSWKGALNFYTIFKNNKGNVDSINFIVNNVPKKYSYSTVSELFGFDFNILAFIPFEYGIFESFGKDPIEDEILPSTQFYSKIGYISNRIFNQMGRMDLLSEKMKTFGTESIKRDLKETYDRSGDRKTLRLELVKEIIKSALLMAVGLFIIVLNTNLFEFSLEYIFIILGTLFLAMGFYTYIQTLRKYTGMKIFTIKRR